MMLAHTIVCKGVAEKLASEELTYIGQGVLCMCQVYM